MLDEATLRRIKEIAVERACQAYLQTLLDELAKASSGDVAVAEVAVAAASLHATKHTHDALLIIDTTTVCVRSTWEFSTDAAVVLSAVEKAKAKGRWLTVGELRPAGSRSS